MCWAVTTASQQEEGRADRDGDGIDANRRDGAVSVWGISRPSRHSKRRLTTQAGDSSREGEIAPPRVQAGAESGKMRVDLCPRGDLNPEAREISPIRGNFHGSSLTVDARRRHAFPVPSAFPGRAAGDVRGEPLRGALGRGPVSRSVLSAESGQAKYPPIGATSRNRRFQRSGALIRSIWDMRLPSRPAAIPKSRKPPILHTTGALFHHLLSMNAVAANSLEKSFGETVTHSRPRTNLAL
jgi:hypothetical protein